MPTSPRIAAAAVAAAVGLILAPAAPALARPLAHDIQRPSHPRAAEAPHLPGAERPRGSLSSVADTVTDAWKSLADELGDASDSFRQITAGLQNRLDDNLQKRIDELAADYSPFSPRCGDNNFCTPRRTG